MRRSNSSASAQSAQNALSGQSGAQGGMTRRKGATPPQRRLSAASSGSTPSGPSGPSAQQALTAQQLAGILADAPAPVRDAMLDMVRAARLSAQEREAADGGGSGSGGGAPHEAVLEVLAGLERVTPQLHEYPGAMMQVERMLQRANAQAYAATMPLYQTQGYADMVRANGSDGRPSGTVGQSTGAGPTFSFLSTSGREQPQGVPNARQLRNWADSVAWLRAAIDVRKEQIGHAEIAVLPQNPRKSLPSGGRRVQTAVQTLLQQPNRLLQNWSEFIGGTLEDYLVLARGCIEKVQTVGGTPIELYQLNAAGLKIYPGWDGSPDLPRYLYEDPDAGPSEDGKRPLFNDEAIVIMGNPGSYRFSLSLVQVLVEEIQADMAAMKAAKKTVALRPPPNLVNIPGMSPLDIQRLAMRLESEFAGKKDIALIATDPSQMAQVFSLVSSAKDSQFLELQIYLARKICAVMRISPQQVGITFDINRANGEVQQDIASDTGRIPVFLTVEHYLNRELLGDFAPFMKDGWRRDLDALNLRVIFPEISEAARLEHVQQVAGLLTDGLAGLPFITLNMALATLGEEPVPGGNTFYVDSKNGPIPWLSYDGETGDYVGPTDASPAEGGQDAGGGPSTEEGDMDDTPNEKPDENNGNAGGQNTGGAASGNGAGSGAAADAGGDSGSSAGGNGGGSGGASASASYTLHLLADTRPPGVAWQPWHSGMAGGRLTQQAGGMTRRVASSARPSVRRSSQHPQDGDSASSPRIAPYRPSSPAEMTRLATPGKRPQRTMSSRPTMKGPPAAADGADDARDDHDHGGHEHPERPAITAVGRAPATLRDNYRRSAGKRDAISTLEQEARRIFEEAAERGRNA